jgi:hypothetical protein
MLTDRDKAEQALAITHLRAAAPTPPRALSSGLRLASPDIFLARNSRTPRWKSAKTVSSRAISSAALRYENAQPLVAFGLAWRGVRLRRLLDRADVPQPGSCDAQLRYPASR